uniref:Uncharacterized protein n=1 Tax=Trypanosoma congolense (strain IL3000) TaxID=1068625 RepID=G0UK70_TRYCI|nr:conserved hypothetical protein [Trypanosoma congolense IL3000]
MCHGGRTNHFFTDSESCFMGGDMRLYQCVCPIATCTSTGAGHACRLTTSFLTFSGVLLLLWFLVAAAYVYVIGLSNEHQRHHLPERHGTVPGGYYYNKLFGSDDESGVAEVAVPNLNVPSCLKAVHEGKK